MCQCALRGIRYHTYLANKMQYMIKAMAFDLESPETLHEFLKLFDHGVVVLRVVERYAEDLRHD